MSDAKQPPTHENTRATVAQSDLATFRPPLRRSQTGVNNYRKTPVFRSLGQPGAKDDVLRRGMSGADSKWYLRYLDEGKEPAEARRLALARKDYRGPTTNQGAANNPDTPRLGSGKRDISRETPPEIVTKKPRSHLDQSSSRRSQMRPTSRQSRIDLPSTSAAPPPQVDYADIRVIKVGISSP